MGSRQRRQGGRMFPHERDTNDVVPILGDNIEVAENFQEQYNETHALSMSDKNQKDYRARLVRVATYWKENCEEYYQVGVREIGEDEQNDASRFFYSGLYKLDLKYTGLNYKFVLEFLMNTKTKKNRRLTSNQDIRKYKDAILWGATIAGEQLPTKFYEEIDNKYLASYKKLVIDAKKKGTIDETAADPITVTLYQGILRWAVEANNAFVWFWTLCQWNCMA
jgi:hypothetical protein